MSNGNNNLKAEMELRGHHQKKSFHDGRKNKMSRKMIWLDSKDNGGDGEIRTLEWLSPLHAFQACSFDRSDTTPSRVGFIINNLRGFCLHSILGYSCFSWLLLVVMFPNCSQK